MAIYYESTAHIQRALAQVRASGAMAAVALNPGTPAEVIRDVLPNVGMVLIMTVNPGFAGQKIIPQTVDKMRRTRRMLDDAGQPQIMIVVDGNSSFDNIPVLYKAGAEVFIVGSSSLFAPGIGIGQAAKRIRESLQ